MIKVVLADDQPIFRNGLKLFLEQDPELQVAGCAANGQEALKLCAELEPDVILMDLVMPVLSGTEAIAAVKEHYPVVKVIALTTFNDAGTASRALSYGADGFIFKDVEPEELISAVKSVMRGMKVIHSDAYQAFRNQETSRAKSEESSEKPACKLNEREKEIIRHIVYGCSNKQIATQVHLSEGRVRNIISDILSSLGLNDRTQLAVFAVKNNLV